MDLDLAGKRAIVTGGTRGIGRSIVERLAREGASVALCARTASAVEEAVASLTAHGVRAFGAALDVRDGQAFTSWFEGAVRELGGLDIAVSNVSTRPTQQGESAWREAFETDFLQHVRMSNLALPHLQQGRDAAMLFVSSIASVLTILPPGEDGYGTMKAALVSLTGQLAARFGPKGVRVNAVSPGPILFPGGVWDQIRAAHPPLFERAAQLSALGRHGRPEEVADAIAFLVSPRASYITGANLRIDGAAVKAVNY
jgi:3-oxoacyl-[acyl-carrier protein] reductase